MDNNENKKVPEELTDEALDKVAGGRIYADGSYMCTEEERKISAYVQNFVARNCYDCSMDSTNCVLLLSDEAIYAMFGGNPNARCQFFSM